MNRIPIYQNPIVDVFQVSNLSEWTSCHKEGKVVENVWDKTIGKNVFHVQGSSSSSNYIQIPSSKFLPKKALGLIGQYVYLLVKKEAGKDCTIHLDYIINETRLVTISLSSIFKNYKNLSGSSLQVPFHIPDERWTVAVVEVKKLLQDENLLTLDQNFYLRSLTLGCTVFVKGVYTSDIAYTVQTFPKKFAFKILNQQEWFALYSWYQYPGQVPHDGEQTITQPEEAKDQAPSPADKQKSKKTEKLTTKPGDKPKTTSKIPSVKKPATKDRLNKDLPNTEKKVKIEESKSATDAQLQPKDKDGSTTEASTIKPKKKAKETEKDKKPKFPFEEKHFEMLSPTNEENKEEKAKLIEHCNQKIQENMSEIQNLKELYQYNLTAKSIEQTAEVKLYDDDALNNPKFDAAHQRTKGEKFVLKPNPIMRLDRVVGWHPNNTSAQIFFNPDPKLSQEILYSQANLLLGYYPPIQKQRLFYERHTNNIDQLFVAALPGYKNYAFTVCKSLEQNSRDNEITVWSLESLDTTNCDSQSLATFKPPMKLIHSLSVSPDGDMLLLGGKDHQSRDLLIVYKFQDLVRFQRPEIIARQLADFEMYSAKFNPYFNSSIVACGKENIKFYKIKNGHLAGQAVVLNNTARGKYFTNTQMLASQSTNAKTGKTEIKPSICFVTSSDGLLYFINFNSRMVEKVLQIHEGPISGFISSSTNDFFVTSSLNGILRIWSTDFENLKSEVNTGNQINHIDINSDSNQICVLSSNQGTISLLDLENSSYNVVMRSHQDNINDIVHNQMTGLLVTVSDDFSVKVWNSESMEQVNEFISENDKPICLATQNQGLLGDGIKSEDNDCLVAIGFQSGFLRILDLSQMKIVHETLYFESPLMNIDFSLDNRFMAVFFKSGKIVIIKKDIPNQFLPVKNIDYEFAQSNCSLCFSRDGALLANISSNSNIVTVWETRNFSLRYHLDLTGDIISKLRFAPNGKDLVVLTTASKFKFYRIPNDPRQPELEHIKDAYGITDLECLDFQISENNKFIVCAGKEGVIKIFDYFMRGEVLPSQQAFMGHYQYPNKVVISKDLRSVFSIGPWNGIYKWQFYGDNSYPKNIEEVFEELESEKLRKAALTDEDKERQKVNEGMFDTDDLAAYTAKQIENFKNSNSNLAQNLKNKNMAQNLGQTMQSGQSYEKYGVNPFQNTVEINKGGYVYEQFDMKLNKLLACGNGHTVNNNLVWHEKHRYICYSVNNILVIEYLNQEKTQRLIKDSNNPLYQVMLSDDKTFLLAYSKSKGVDAFPCIFIYDAQNFKKLNEIAINGDTIDSVRFSWQNNMLLVVSSENSGANLISTLTVWDFTQGHKDIFCKSILPIPIVDSQWNPYVQVNADEFITISQRQYHYWRISSELRLDYQEGQMPTKAHEGFQSKTDQFTCITFVKPSQYHHSVYAMIGLQSGYVWVTDAKTNQFLFNVKVLNDGVGGVSRIFSSHARIIIESANSPIIRCWDQSGKNGDKEYSQYNPHNFFMGVEQTLSIDGNFKSTFYNDTGNQFMALSTSGSIWYLSWIELCTLRLKYCHNPQERISCADFKYVPPSEFMVQEEQDSLYTFDQNYQISTASSDGNIKLWNMHDLEYSQQFMIPKEECKVIAMHQFKPYMVTSYSDGWIRFFDINNSKLLGRTEIHSSRDQPSDVDLIVPNKVVDTGKVHLSREQNVIVDYVVSLKILPSGNHILAATKYGQIVLIYVTDWNPLSIRIQSLVSMQTQISQFEFSHLEPYNKWLVATANGKVVVYNRKDFNSLNQEIFDEIKPPVFNYMDSFNVLDYVSNSYSQTRRCNTLDHFYSMAKRNLVDNEVDRMNECFGIFANNDQTLHLSFIKQCNQLFIRNFELHQVVKRIEMSNTGLPIEMQLLPGSSPFICVSFTDNKIKMVDFMNEENQTSIQTLHEQLTTMKICPNGRYVLTGGNLGDVSLWSIKKKILGPEVMMDAVHMYNA